MLVTALLLAGITGVMLPAPPGDADSYTLVKFNSTTAPWAQCLDGTYGGYYWKQGAEKSSVVVHMEGGGWCYDEQLCLARAKTAIGSSATWAPAGVPAMDGGAEGVLSFDSVENPDFYNWTKFHLNYCDGASYAGSGSTTVGTTVGTTAKTTLVTTLQFRGAAILDAFIDALLTTGGLASGGGSLIVGGTSAGGLATYLHLDHYAARMPSDVRVVGMPDAGFFLDIPDYAGTNLYPAQMQYVSKMQNVSAHVNRDCITANPGNDEWKCFMAEYTAPHIKTPFFALQSAYDEWQMSNVVALPCGMPHCNTTEKAAFLGFRDQLLDRLKPTLALPQFGIWLDSCFLHGQQDVHGDWNKLTISGVTAAKAFGDWFFNRSSAAQRQHIDCPYPCCDDKY